MIYQEQYHKAFAAKLFYPCELQQNGEINILRIKFNDNYADLFTKSLLATIFQKYNMLELVCIVLDICKV